MITFINSCFYLNRTVLMDEDILEYSVDTTDALEPQQPERR